MLRFHKKGLDQLVAALEFLQSEGASNVEVATARALLRSILYENYDTHRRRYKWASAVFVSQAAYSAWEEAGRAFDSKQPTKVVFEHVIPVKETIDALRISYTGDNANRPDSEGILKILTKFYGPTAIILRTEELRVDGKCDGLKQKRENRRNVFDRYERARHINLWLNPYYPIGEDGYYSAAELKTLVDGSNGCCSQEKKERIGDKRRCSHQAPFRAWSSHD